MNPFRLSYRLNEKIHKFKTSLGFKPWNYYRCPKCGGLWEQKSYESKPECGNCSCKTYKISEREFEDRMDGKYNEGKK